jgi:DNA (cytosine-5)-methyltransferase 1
MGGERNEMAIQRGRKASPPSDSRAKAILKAIEAPAFRFIDLFAGIGGLRRGFEHIGGRCVFTSEWDAKCQETYRLNYADNHEIAGDIRPFAENPDRVPEHDVLLAGFPCQPFSIAGVSKKNALGSLATAN